MNRIVIVSSFCVLFLFGCGPSIRAMGGDTYLINATSPWGVSGANSDFHEGAMKACRGRSYDVLNTQQ